jgi:hypothetical protein
MGPGTSLDNVNRTFLTLPGLELRPRGRPARSLSLYRLRYPGSIVCVHNGYKFVGQAVGWISALYSTRYFPLSPNSKISVLPFS